MRISDRSRAGARWIAPLLLLGTIHSAAAAAPASLDVDAREAPRGIMTAHLHLPVSAGPLTLVYPKWLPGRHSPAGPLTSLGGPRFTANGRALSWRRDAVDMNAFSVDIPAGVSSLDVDLEMLTAPAPDGVVQGLETPRTATESLLILEWNQLLLYPAGTRSDDLSYQASVHLPRGWKFATALQTSAVTADGAQFAPVSLTTLVDSTLLAGRYVRDIPLGGAPAVTLHLAADTPVALNMSPETQAHYRNLVREAIELFGATHYNHYEFLVWNTMNRATIVHRCAPCSTIPSAARKRIYCRTNTPIRGTGNIGGRRVSPRPIIKPPCSTSCSGYTRD